MLSEEQVNKSDDIQSIENIFNLIFDICKQLNPDFQVIILEHANFKTNQKFQDFLVEEFWENGKALIPKNWIN